MFFFHRAKDKERKRFYLFPGQGGRAYRRKQKFIFKCAVAAAILVSLILGGIIYLLNHIRRF